MAGSFFDHFPLPPCAQMLGWELIAEYPREGRLELAFHPTEAMLNPRGTIQGGFVTAMLDDVMGCAFVCSTNGAEAPASIDINTTYVKPVMPGRVIGKGRVVSRGRSIAFLEGELFAEDGTLLARATSTARITAIP